MVDRESLELTHLARHKNKLAMGLGMTVLTVPDGGQKVVAKFRKLPQRTTGS